MDSNQQHRIGRPSLSGDGDTPIRPIRMSDEDWELIRQAAALAGVSAAHYTRTKTVACAKREIKRHEEGE